MKPPRPAERLLRRAIADDAAGWSILGDFEDEFADRAARDGRRRASWWYWRQALSFWIRAAWSHPATSHHQPRGGRVFDLVRDLRQAVRAARQTPGQVLLIATTLALGIGISTVGFAFADTVFLRGLPIARPDQTVIVYAVSAQEPQRRLGVYRSDLIAFRDRVRRVEDLSTWTQSPATLTRRGVDAKRVIVSRTTGELFGVWGLRTALGRGLMPRDQTTAVRVAVLSDRFWRETFAADPGVLGESIVIDGVPHEIVGVMTRDVEFATFANIDAWVAEPLVLGGRRDLTASALTGRLADGVTLEEATAELAAVADSLAIEHPETNQGRGVLVLRATRAMGGPNLVLVMTLLVGSAVLIMVIASVNVAGVLMARAARRSREFALRIALGAGRRRIVQQLIVEGVMLAMLGGAGGLAVAAGGLRVIRLVGIEPIFHQITVDSHELIFVAGLSGVTPLLFALAPAAALLRMNVNGMLTAGSPRVIGGGTRLRNGLVVAQMTVAIALAVVGGLVARTAVALINAPTGYDTAGLVTFGMSLDGLGAETVARRRAMQAINDRLASELNARAGTLSLLPSVATEISSPVSIAGPLTPAREQFRAHLVGVDATALETLGVTLVDGRWLTAADVDSDANVALISRTAALRYFGSAAAALDRELTVFLPTSTRGFRVVGVTSDVRDVNPEEGVPARVWLPLSTPGSVVFAVRAPSDLSVVAETIRRTSRTIAPDVPVEQLLTIDEALKRRTASDRVAMGMLVSFAVIGVIFAAIGLYSTIALSAQARRPEFATRLALGARLIDVAGLVAGQTLLLTCLGALPGAVLGFAAGSVARRTLYGVAPLDPANIAGLALLIALVSVAAGLAPALRASRVNVIETMRGE